MLRRARRWLQAEDGGPRLGESHVGPKNSVLAATGFTRQAVGIRLGRGLLDCRHRGDGRELTTIGLAGCTTETM